MWSNSDELIKRQSCDHIETSQSICRADQLTGFYMMATLACNELMKSNEAKKELIGLILHGKFELFLLRGDIVHWETVKNSVTINGAIPSQHLHVQSQQ